MADDGHEDEQARRRADVEGKADAEAVDEAVQREAGRAEGADPGMGARLLRLVAVVQDEHALDQKDPMNPAPMSVAMTRGRAARVHRLRQDVEERDRHDDPAGEGDQGHDLPMQPEGDQPPQNVETTVTAARGMAIHVI